MARILIAENNEHIAAYLRTLLMKAGHKVTVTTSSLDAWRASTGGQHDALLINVVMPGIDGFVLAQRALTENPDMHVIFLTGFAAVAMDGATPNYAPAPFTSRPFHIRQMNARLHALMNGGYPDAALPQTDGTVIYATFGSKAPVALEA